MDPYALWVIPDSRKYPYIQCTYTMGSILEFQGGGRGASWTEILKVWEGLVNSSEFGAGFNYGFPKGVTARASLEIIDLFTFLVHTSITNLHGLQIEKKDLFIKAAFMRTKVDQMWIVQQAADQGGLN